MTKYLKLFMVALFATLTFTLTSCGDDDEPSSAGNIVGTWKSIGGMNEEFDITQYIQFNTNGSYIEVNIDEDGVETLHGKWKQNGEKVTVSGSDVISMTATIVKITSSELVLNTLWEQKYKKVSDSEIEKYLK